MIIKPEALTFDDVLLEPQYSEVWSRKNLDTQATLGGFNLSIPVVSANMDTVTEYTMAKTMGELGGLGIIHRYATPGSIMNWITMLREKGLPACASVGIADEDLGHALNYIATGATGICIDVAHGDNPRVAELAAKIKRESPGTTVIAGNVATRMGFLRLVKKGRVDVVKVGIGPGSLCTTRVVTGHGVPQLTAIMQCAEARDELANEVCIIADGGIRNSGDAVKALAAGANAVMLGGLLAGTDETPGDLITKPDGKWYKRYRGMASRDAQIGWKGTVSGVPEGESVLAPYRFSVKSIIEDFVAGIRSGMSYSGATTLDELREAATFIRVTQSAVRENGAHFEADRCSQK